MGVDRARLFRRQHVGGRLRQPRVGAAGGDAKPHGVALPSGSTLSTPPRGMLCWTITSMLSNSLTRFFASRSRGSVHVSLVLPSSRWPRAIVSASPRSIWAPAEPAAPNARRQNCSRADAFLALLRIRSRANSRSSGEGLSSITSSPLTMAPTGLMRSADPRAQQRGEFELVGGCARAGLGRDGDDRCRTSKFPRDRAARAVESSLVMV